MSPLLKNLGGALVALTIAYVGYSFYAQSTDAAALSGASTYTEDMVVDAQIFIERRNTLDKLKIETDIFSDPVFSSYKTFSRPIQGSATGRTNPFDAAVPQINGSNF